jgi:hypothetical protein
MYCSRTAKEVQMVIKKRTLFSALATYVFSCLYRHGIVNLTPEATKLATQAR